MLTTSTHIKLALTFSEKTQTFVANELGMSQQNFAQKLKRETFTYYEINKIAEILGAKFVSYFEFPDGTKI